MDNIFKMSLEEIDKKMDEILSKTTPEKLIEDLKKCGYEGNETIELLLKDNNYKYKKETTITHKNKYKQFIHKNRTNSLNTFSDNMEVA